MFLVVLRCKIDGMRRIALGFEACKSFQQCAATAADWEPIGDGGDHVRKVLFSLNSQMAALEPWAAGAALKLPGA